MGRRVEAILGTLLLLVTVSQFSFTSAFANGPVVLESLTLTVYFDGFVLANHEIELDQNFPSVNVTLLGETYEEVLVVDEESLPLDYELINSKAIIHSLGAGQITVAYFTPDLTSKIGKIWTLSAEVSTNVTVMLPEDASIISLNDVPELIGSSNGQVSLVMPSGIIEIAYIAERSLYQGTESFEMWLPITITSFPIIASMVFALWFLRRKKPPKPKKLENEVDVNKLFVREKYLRQEEVQMIRFLAEKHGTAFEADLYEKLNLPRTTTWRLIKRLQKMEIVDVKKSRRQNIVSIRKKYMKK
ncbi:MAG: hypothetical protein NWE80_01150 [Candidatus Bathyarchaeota archaeon]|nr:hypothetical protein [Candidatus Bathyarchaeota archaeon]